MIELMPHQEQALEFLDNGKILYGGVGAGKSAVALAYYMKRELPADIFVITTAKKRDSLDWNAEAAKFGIGRTPDGTVAGVLTVDSWHNIKRYENVKDAFFIFDEQKVIGHGAWVKSFLKIVKRNRWILLTATPGDVWLDYAPVFVANGLYANISEFKRRHVRYAPYIKYPIVIGYHDEELLEKFRNDILVEMPYKNEKNKYVNFMQVDYDKELVKTVIKNRWNPFTNLPILDASELWRVIRRIVNSDPSRFEMVRMLLKCHPKLIIFYNFDYELGILRGLGNANLWDIGYGNTRATVAEWNGHRHEDIPETDVWVYLVQFLAGGEGWNCIQTNAVSIYSLTYSYKNYVQAMGRIDRLNSPFHNLYYYVLTSDAYIDNVVKAALDQKRSFNELSALTAWKIRGNPAKNSADEYRFDERLPWF